MFLYVNITRSLLYYHCVVHEDQRIGSIDSLTVNVVLACSLQFLYNTDRLFLSELDSDMKNLLEINPITRFEEN